MSVSLLLISSFWWVAYGIEGLVIDSIVPGWTQLTTLQGHTVTATSESLDNLALQHDGDIDYLVTMDEDTIPIFHSPLALTFHLPQWGPNHVPQFTLTRDALCGIFTGNIDTWDDPALGATNLALADVVPPNATLTVLYYADSSSLNLVLSATLTSMGCEGWAANRTLPAAVTSKPNFVGVSASSPAQMLSRLLSSPFTLGYNAFSFSQGQGLSHARVENLHGVFVSPEDVVRLPHYPPPEFEQDPPATVVDLAGPWAYPFMGQLGIQMEFSPAMLGPQACARQTEVGQFVGSLWTTATEGDLTRAGLVGLAPKLAASAAMEMATYYCAGQGLLSDQQEATEPTAKMLSINGGLNGTAVCIAVLALFMSFFSLADKSCFSLSYGVLYCLGTGLLLGAYAPWSHAPETDAICRARYYVPAFGYALVVALLFARLRAFEVIHTIQITGSLRLQPTFAALKLLLTILSVEGIFLIVWACVLPPKAVQTGWTSDGGMITPRYECNQTENLIFVQLQLIGYAVLVAYGVYIICHSLVFQFEQGIHEMRFILVALYNLCVSWVFAGVLIGVGELSPEAISLLIKATLLFGAGNFLLTLLPRLIFKAGENDGPGFAKKQNRVSRSRAGSNIFRGKSISRVRNTKSPGSVHTVRNGPTHSTAGAMKDSIIPDECEMDAFENPKPLRPPQNQTQTLSAAAWPTPSSSHLPASPDMGMDRARTFDFSDRPQLEMMDSTPVPAEGQKATINTNPEPADIDTEIQATPRIPKETSTPRIPKETSTSSPQEHANPHSRRSMSLHSVPGKTMTMADAYPKQARNSVPLEGEIAVTADALAKLSQNAPSKPIADDNKSDSGSHISTGSEHWKIAESAEAHNLQSNSRLNMIVSQNNPGQPSRGRFPPIGRTDSKASGFSAGVSLTADNQSETSGTSAGGDTDGRGALYQSQQFDLAIKSKDVNLLKYANEHHAAGAISYLFSWYGAELESWDDFVDIFDRYIKTSATLALNLPSILYDRMCRIMVEQNLDSARSFKPALDAEIYRDTLSNTWLSFSQGQDAKELAAWERLVLSTVGNPDFHNEFYQFFFLLRPDFAAMLSTHNKRKHALDGWLKLISWGIHGQKIKTKYARRLRASHMALRLHPLDYWFHCASFILVVVKFNPDVTLDILKSIAKTYGAAIQIITGKTLGHSSKEACLIA